MFGKECYDLIIVGGGPGGLTTGIYALRAALKTVLIERGVPGARRNIETEGVFIFVGFAPNNQLVPAGIKTNRTGYVITDEKCETDIPGIFAVGNLRQKYANQIVLAAADGCTAALAAAHYVETRKGGQRCQHDGLSDEQNAKQVIQ